MEENDFTEATRLIVRSKIRGWSQARIDSWLDGYRELRDPSSQRRFLANWSHILDHEKAPTP